MERLVKVLFCLHVEKIRKFTSDQFEVQNKTEQYFSSQSNHLLCTSRVGKGGGDDGEGVVVVAAGMSIEGGCGRGNYGV